MKEVVRGAVRRERRDANLYRVIVQIDLFFRPAFEEASISPDY